MDAGDDAAASRGQSGLLLRRFSAFSNWVGLMGSLLVVASLFAFLLLFAIDGLSGHSNAYLGILAYLVAPAFLFAGLLLVVVGWVLFRKQVRSRDPSASMGISMDFSKAGDRRKLLLIFSSVVLFLMLTALGCYRTYHYTESVAFCGQVCHTVMEPEYRAYQHSSHARVACVECHIGSGVDWYVKSKISGIRQVFAVMSNRFSRPIETPIANLRPAQETCEQCHWPQKFSGNLDRTYPHYLFDEENTAFHVRMLLKVGGGDPSKGAVSGIHWHTSSGHKVEYYAGDPDRLSIPWVRMTDAQGHASVFRSPDFVDEPDPSAIRTMDCMDCHNRPAHAFSAPNDAIDEALFSGRLDRSLPDIRFNAVDLLTGDYPDRQTALRAIEASLRDAYEGHSGLDQAIQTVQEVYQSNFFPAMRASWERYPEHLGHKDWPGCFRCHDGQHLNEDGNAAIRVAANDCRSCHLILAQGEEVNAGQVDLSGLEFEHPGEDVEGLLCSDCHNGAIQ
jgi:nitrate/TMAO reductase-like tetraheme cytochrome c subunit